jgi:hypothetical protein
VLWAVEPAGRGGLGKLPGGLVFAVGADDPCAAFAFGFGLPRHRAFHLLGQRDVPDFNPLYPDAPSWLT